MAAAGPAGRVSGAGGAAEPGRTARAPAPATAPAPAPVPTTALPVPLCVSAGNSGGGASGEAQNAQRSPMISRPHHRHRSRRTEETSW